MPTGLKITIKKRSAASFFSALLYLTALDFAYYFHIARVWGYEGFILNPNPVKIIESFFLFLFVFLLMPKSSNRISDVLIWLLVLFSFIPMLTFFSMADGSRFYIYGAAFFWAMVSIFSRFVPTPKIAFLEKKQAKTLYSLFFLFFATVTAVLIYIFGAFGINLDLNKVYEVRTLFVGLQIPFAGYLLNWLALVFNPMFFAIFLKQRKWFFLAGITVFQIILFSITGNKVYLFALPYVLFLILILRKRNPLFFASIGMIAIIIIGAFSFVAFDNGWISALFTNRTLLAPALVSFDYYDFFSNNQLIYLSSYRLFNKFIEYPYDLDPPHLIGSTYFNNPNMNVNSGIIADAYMNFGFWGFFFVAALLIFFLKIVDCFSKNKSIDIVAATIGISVIIFTNTPFLTSFLTNGILLGLFLLYLLPRENEKDLHSYN